MITDTQKNFSSVLQNICSVAVARHHATFARAAERIEIEQHRLAGRGIEHELIGPLAVGHDLQNVGWRHCGTPCSAPAFAATARALIIAAWFGSASVACFCAFALARACAFAAIACGSDIHASGVLLIRAISGIAVGKSKGSSRLMSWVTLTSSRTCSTVRRKPAALPAE